MNAVDSCVGRVEKPKTPYIKKRMKRYCKNITLDQNFITACIYECLSDKWNRMDTARFLANYTNIITARQIHRIIKENFKDWLHNLVCTAAAGMEEEIKLRKVSFDPIKTSARLDGNSGKVRDIGVECIKQQIYDYVATNGLKELFVRKVGTYQCASIPGRGQVYGKTAIENWIRKNPGKTRVAAKGDVRKCYPSINRRKMKRMLEKQVRNEDLLYLTFVLIDSFDQGLSIGSYLSQWLCNYYLSAAYHYAAEKLFKRKKHRDGTTEEIRLINHVLFYMDDFILIGSRKADVRKAMKLLVKYMNEYLDLTVKPDWKLFQIDWIDKEGKHHGEPIDMMGFKIYRDHTEVRRSIFLRGRRAFVKAGKYAEKGKAIPLDLAYRCIAYYGWFKHSDSEYFREKYNVDKIFEKAKRRVSRESKIYRKTGSCNLECAA